MKQSYGVSIILLCWVQWSHVQNRSKHRYLMMIFDEYPSSWSLQKHLKDSYEKHWNETMDYKNKPRLNGYENVRISHENNKRQLYN